MADLTPAEQRDADAKRLEAEIAKLPYDDDIRIIDGELETPEARTARQKAEARDTADQQKLIKQLERDPESTQGTVSYSEGNSPEELAELEARAALTDIERLELDQGFRFGDPDGEAAGTPKATRALICRNPDCSMQGEHIAVHHDTLQPIRCGGLITDPSTGDTRPCGAVLLCDHDTGTSTTTEGTIAAPVKITITKCTKCGTVTDKTEETQPPVNIGDLPYGLIEALGGTPVADADRSTS